ncbi:MAG: ribosome assembly RNA-binding protein YhbY [Myxococcales bacterium]|nr:ribosome assembly RNA-binding protein YhbY [Myxococcales bacterium]MCB9750487.1 ribosome assembly RNA-binding protein YhbY [Myxococcales bacterium]
MSSPVLNSHQRAFLKSLAHPLKPVVLVGSDGLTPGLEGAVDRALEDHELIKVKLGQSFTGERRSAASSLGAATDAAVVQVIGRMIVLFRPRPGERDGRARIELPA